MKYEERWEIPQAEGEEEAIPSVVPELNSIRVSAEQRANLETVPATVIFGAKIARKSNYSPGN